MDDFCWPIDQSCCTQFEDYDFDVQDRSIAFAGATLRMLTGYRVGGCPIQVRPCRKVCADWQPYYYPQNSWGPVNWNGTWYNCLCGMTECGCGALCQLELPTPIGAVTQVLVDGAVVPSTAYRVDDGRWLVRTDGHCWPDCQDLSKDPTQVGTFAVTYLNALPVTPLGEYAAGLLACEFAKACSGGKCRLPSGVTAITRQGITMDLAIGVFPDGLTGIHEVDAYVALYNPGHRRPTAIWTPDSPIVRTTTVP